MGGSITLEDSKGRPVKKRSKFQEEEINGAVQAAKYYPLVQHPTKLNTGELLYLFFDRKSLAALRVSYILNRRTDSALRNFILAVELRKAEDILRAYVQFFRKDAPVNSPQINRLFYDRVVNGNP